MAYNENADRNLIEKKSNPGLPLDFDNLRSLGIDLTQQLSGEIWTDYNLHDPGITILEYLCYALTDLAYRTSFDLEDILTTKQGHINREKNFFFTRREILSTNPVSVNDFRKVIIDTVPDIYNAWLEPVLSNNRMKYCKGLYKVIIQLNDEKVNVLWNANEVEKDALKNNVLRTVKNCVNEYRNVGEDFEDFIILKPAEIKINATVVIGPNEPPEEILAEIYAVLYKTLNPKIHFYFERELQEKGYSPEEINNGPMLQNGFIPDEDLTPRAKFIDPSDMVKAIAGIKGVLLIQELYIAVNDKKYERELCPINDEDFLFFNYNSDVISIQLVNDDFKVPVKPSLFRSRLKIKLDQLTRVNKRIEMKESYEGNKPDDQFHIKGSYRNLHKYVSIQYLFPEIYKLKISLEDTGSDGNKKNKIEIAKVKQLKAFLMMFEQVIVNYLAQLSNIDNIFSADIDENNYQTYFTQPVFDVPGAEKIINAYHDGLRKNDQWEWDKFTKDDNNTYRKFLNRKSETDAIFINRKNRIFDHIFSRFNFILHQYPLQLYRELYGWDKMERRMVPELLWKKDLLKNLIAGLRNRNQAYNYNQRPREKKMGGFQQKMLRLLYIAVEQSPGSSKINDFLIKPLSPVFSKLTMLPHKVNTEEAKRTETYVIRWQGEQLNILKDPAFEEEQPAAKKNDNKSVPLTFKKTGISFFKNGVNAKNYKIVPANNDKNVKLLIYKPPSGVNWQVVGKFNNFSEAIESRNRFISELRKINIESEGFHMVEHILLRPDLSFSQFGFKIQDEDNHLLCTHNEWISFESRDKNIAKLISYMHQNSDLLHEDFENEFERICKIAVEHSETPHNVIRPSLIRHAYRNKKEELVKIYDRLIGNLKKIGENQAYGYTKIKTLVKRFNGDEIAEDFFNFRATVVLPAWPARFQDIPFREFIKKLFIENCPAHMRLHFKWLNIKQMKEFETIYFDWLAAISKDKSSLKISESADALIALLYDAGGY